MNNSEAIKKRFEDRFMPEQDRVPYYVLYDDALEFMLEEVSRVRSEAFEEAIQALPEKKEYLDTSDRSYWGEEYERAESLRASAYNRAISEIKEILMKLKGKNG